jgi:phosphoglycolate phosphatase
VARKRSALKHLQDQFRERETGKTYLALVVGDWPASRKVIDAPLHKYLLADGERRVKVVGKDDPDGMKSVTLVQVRQRLTGFTLLEVTIKTGRTHQIRVHLASQGHPIAGDDKYGDFERNKALQKQGLRRMFLHAWRLQFNHPSNGERLDLLAPLPPELESFLHHVRPPRQFDLIAFDWDGTLFDSTALITRSIQRAVQDVGGSPPSDRDASFVIGMGLMQALAHAAPDVPKERYPELGARYRHHYGLHQNDISLFDGVLPLLDDLRQRNHLLAVATGKSRGGLNEALRAAELRGTFDGSRTADETAGKPDPLMLQELMREFDVPPERTLMIGDTTHDLQMALNAGCASVGVSYGAHEPDGFHALKPRFVGHTVRELHDWLLANG